MAGYLEQWLSEVHKRLRYHGRRDLSDFFNLSLQCKIVAVGYLVVSMY